MDEVAFRVLSLSEAAADPKGFFTRIGVDTRRLYIMPLEAYQEKAKDLCRNTIPLEEEAAHLTAVIRNVVMELSLRMPYRELQIDHVYDVLSDDGYQNNKKKFRGAYVTYGGTLNVKLTLYKNCNRIDGKGASDLFTHHAALELLFSLLRDKLQEGRQDALVVERLDVLTIVASCVFDFGMPHDAMLRLFPDNCELMRNDTRKQKKTSAAQFQGAIYKITLGEVARDGQLVPVTARMLYQDGRPTVTCVGCSDNAHVKLAFSRLYRDVKWALQTHRAHRAPPPPIPAIAVSDASPDDFAWDANTPTSTIHLKVNGTPGQAKKKSRQQKNTSTNKKRKVASLRKDSEERKEKGTNRSDGREEREEKEPDGGILHDRGNKKRKRLADDEVAATAPTANKRKKRTALSTPFQDVADDTLPPFDDTGSGGTVQNTE